MDLAQLIERVARQFAERQIRYFTFGAVAMGLWIPPRLTQDLDLIVRVDPGSLEEFLKTLIESGFRVTRDYGRKLREGRILQLPIGRTRLDMKLCRSPHDESALLRARPADMGGFTLMIATPEDLVLYKLQAWRRLDQADLERLKKEIPDLDGRYLSTWFGRIEAETGVPMRSRWGELDAG